MRDLDRSVLHSRLKALEVSTHRCAKARPNFQHPAGTACLEAAQIHFYPIAMLRPCFATLLLRKSGPLSVEISLIVELRNFLRTHIHLAESAIDTFQYLIAVSLQVRLYRRRADAADRQDDPSRTDSAFAPGAAELAVRLGEIPGRPPAAPIYCPQYCESVRTLPVQKLVSNPARAG